MSRRLIIATAVIAAAMPTLAAAAPATVTGDVNLRSGPGARYQRLATVPAGSLIEVYGCSAWCQVDFAGRAGWISGNYVDSRGGQPSVYRPAPSVGLSSGNTATDDFGWGGRYIDRFAPSWADRAWYERPDSSFSAGPAK